MRSKGAAGVAETLEGVFGGAFGRAEGLEEGFVAGAVVYGPDEGNAIAVVEVIVVGVVVGVDGVGLVVDHYLEGGGEVNAVVGQDRCCGVD